MVWQASQSNQKAVFISLTILPSYIKPFVVVVVVCLLVWSWADSLPSELPNKTRAASSEKWYKILFLKWSTEWKPWAPFWRINKLCILNIVNSQAHELQTEQLIMQLFFYSPPAVSSPEWRHVIVHIFMGLHKLQESLCNFLKFLFVSLFYYLDWTW